MNAAGSYSSKRVQETSLTRPMVIQSLARQANLFRVCRSFVELWGVRESFREGQGGKGILLMTLL